MFGSSQRVRRSRVYALLVVVVLVLTAMIVAGLLWKLGADDRVLSSRNGTSAADCNRATGQATRSDANRAITVGSENVAVIGDSYTASPKTDGWAQRVGTVQRWTLFTDGVSGTGFSSGGPCGSQEYSTRIVHALSLSPQILILQGGLNDTQFPSDVLRSDVGEVLRLSAGVPKVIVIGPTRAPRVPRSADVDRTLGSVVTGPGRLYISTLDCQVTYGWDGVHPTPQGYGQLAKCIDDRLEAARSSGSL